MIQSAPVAAIARAASPSRQFAPFIPVEKAVDILAGGDDVSRIGSAQEKDPRMMDKGTASTPAIGKVSTTSPIASVRLMIKTARLMRPALFVRERPAPLSSWRGGVLHMHPSGSTPVSPQR